MVSSRRTIPPPPTSARSGLTKGDARPPLIGSLSIRAGPVIAFSDAFETRVASRHGYRAHNSKRKQGAGYDSQVPFVLARAPGLLGSTTAEAQSDLFWQHADGRRAVWTMEGTTRAHGQLIETELLPDPDPLWQIERPRHLTMLLQHQGDGRLARWWVSCGDPSETFELSPSLPDLNWKVRGSATFNAPLLYLIWQNEADGSNRCLEDGWL